jgi:hypothetical protein
MAALPHKAFSGKVESGFPSENAAKSMKHFQEKWNPVFRQKMRPSQ